MLQTGSCHQEYGEIKISVSDPDPHGSALILVGWILIQEGKKDLQEKKKVQKFHVLQCWMFSFEGEGFSCSLDVLYGGNFSLKISK
jgi:hypothetical protein